MKETQSSKAQKPTAQNKAAGLAAVKKQSQAKAANNYVQGITVGQPANTWGAAPYRPPSAPQRSGPASPNYGGTNNTRAVYDAQMSGNAPLGYTPGGFDDPTIDWNAVYNAMVAPSSRSDGGYADSGWNGGGQMSAPEQIAPPPPPVIQPPASVTQPPAIQVPEAVVSTNTGIVGAPSGETFNAIGGGGTFGSFDRMRNQRNPRSGLSVTPEMLRRAAQARLG